MLCDPLAYLPLSLAYLPLSSLSHLHRFRLRKGQRWQGAQPCACSCAGAAWPLAPAVLGLQRVGGPSLDLVATLPHLSGVHYAHDQAAARNFGA